MGRFCTNCGEPLKEGAKFCGNCGEAVEEKAAMRPKVTYNRPYRPAETQRLQSEAARHEPVEQRQSSGGGFGHFLAGTAIGGFLWNLFGSSSHQETVINHNETIINEYEADDEGLMEERLGDGLDYDEDDICDTDYDDQDDYGDDSYDDDGYYDDGDYDSYDGDGDGGFFDDFDGGDDFGDDDFL